MNNRFRFDAPSVADEEELDDQLVAYNLRKVPCRQGEPFVKFCRCAYNEKNELVGGFCQPSIWITSMPTPSCSALSTTSSISLRLI